MPASLDVRRVNECDSVGEASKDSTDRSAYNHIESCGKLVGSSRDGGKEEAWEFCDLRPPCAVAKVGRVRRSRSDLEHLSMSSSTERTAASGLRGRGRGRGRVRGRGRGGLATRSIGAREARARTLAAAAAASASNQSCGTGPNRSEQTVDAAGEATHSRSSSLTSLTSSSPSIVSISPSTSPSRNSRPAPPPRLPPNITAREVIIISSSPSPPPSKASTSDRESSCSSDGSSDGPRHLGFTMLEAKRRRMDLKKKSYFQDARWFDASRCDEARPAGGDGSAPP